MQALIDWAINRSRTTLSILALLLLAGWVSYQAIPVESDPNIQVPIITVTVVHEGISPEDAERLLAQPMENELRQVDGIEELTAYAAEGSASLTIEFEADFDSDQALLDVREAVDKAQPEFPDAAEEPIVSEVSTNDFAIVTVNFSGQGIPERVLYDAAVLIRDRLEAIPDVLEADLRGEREELLEAVIDPALLEAHGLTSNELLNVVVENNRLIPAGAVDTGQGRFSVKVPGLIETPEDLMSVPVQSDSDAVITLDDVAEVRRTFKDRDSYARVNGVPAISIEVSKRVEANLIDTVAQVRETVEAARSRIPAGVRVFYTQNQAPYARQQVTELQGNIITAGALVMTIVVAALGLRSGILVALAIPTSFLFSLILLNLIGYSFNFMVMFGMLLGLGMLIDGAIVVTELADRKMSEGLEPSSAFSLAAKRMFWPVTASTATTLAAFLPLIFWPGVSGKFMMFLPVTVFTVLVGALLYALLFGPTLGGLIGRPGSRDATAMARIDTLENGDPLQLRGVTGFYARVLDFAARWPFVVLGLTLATLIGAFTLYGELGRGFVFFSDTDPIFAEVSVHARGNLSADEVRDLVLEVEDKIVPIAGIKSLNTRTAPPSGAGFRGSSVSFDRVGSLFIEMEDRDRRERTGEAILEEIRRRTAELAGIRVEVDDFESGPPVGKPIQIQFASRRAALLEPAVARVRRWLDAHVEGLRDIEDTRSLPGIEWRLQVDRARAALFGASVTTVGTAVQMVTNGLKVGEYRPDDAREAIDMRVRFPRGYRDIGMLEQLRVPTLEGPVPISSFVTRTAAPNVDTIQRIDGVRVEFIRANVAPDVLADTKVKEIQAWLDGQNFDPQLDIAFRGANEEQQEAMAFVQTAFGLSLMLMFILLVTQFNSFYQAVLILFAVVMSTAGVLLGLVLAGQPFSAILTGVGIVALAGIVVNNNIVLIDTFNSLGHERPDLSVHARIVRTGAQRLRPVLLTTFTTVFGLLPLANHVSIDLINREIVYGGRTSAFWVPLAQSIVWGLTFATLLTLIATPAMLALPPRVRRARGVVTAYWRRVTRRIRRTGVQPAGGAAR